MLKRLFAVVLACALLWSGFALAEEFEFDISVFEDNPNFEVAFDDMNDTGKIQFAEDSDMTGVFMGISEDEDDGTVLGNMSIAISEEAPPFIGIGAAYLAYDWAFIDEFIIIAGSNRYTFEVECEREVLEGGIMESFVIGFTDESIGLLEDIINSEETAFRYRLSGDDDIDGEMLFSKDSVKLLYETYVASGALENDFFLVEALYPCEIKSM